MAEGEPSYIDYEAFLDPDFSPSGFANTLVLSTNNATDTPLDLSTPLSRVLFDLQEIDTHIHGLTTRSALPLLAHTQSQVGAAEHILKETGSQIASVTQGYDRLEKEVVQKWQAAEEARIAAEKSLATVRLARAVSRCLGLGRQLESQVAEILGRVSSSQASTGTDGSTVSTGKEGFRALERAAYTILNLRQMYLATSEDEEGFGLDRVKVTRTLRNEFIIPAENMVKSRAQQTINQFSISGSGSVSNGQSSGSIYKQNRDSKSRLATAAATLYLLSPTPREGVTVLSYKPELFVSTLQGYMQTAIMSSVNILAKALSQLPSMDRALGDVSARCQDIVSLENILRNLRAPLHPLLVSTTGHAEQPANDSEAGTDQSKVNLLQPVLRNLDTSSLPSYYWRSLASSLTGRVQEIVNRGGVSARTLRSNRDRLKSEIRDCVIRSSQASAPGVANDRGRSGTDPANAANWEREAAVMVSSVIGPLNR